MTTAQSMNSTRLAWGTLFFILLLAQSCKPTLLTSEIKFGTGGGVTGDKSGYTVEIDGQILKTESLAGKQEPVSQLKRSQIKELNSRLSQANLTEVSFVHPGNTYKYLEVGNHAISWGDPAHEPPPTVVSFYDHLNTLVH